MLDAGFQQDIARLDVAVNQAHRMRRGQTGGDLLADAEHVHQHQGTGRVDLLLQRSPGDILHDQIGDGLVLDGVDGDHILVANGRRRPRLAHEALAGHRGRGQERRHELDGDEPMQLLVERPDHGPEAAVAQDLQHLVMRQPAQRAGPLRWLQDAQGALDIVAALLIEGLDRAGPRLGIPRVPFQAACRTNARRVLGRMARVEVIAIDGGLGQEILRSRMGLQEPFHPAAQRVVVAAGVIQIIRPRGRRFLLQSGEEDRFYV